MRFLVSFDKNLGGFPARIPLPPDENHHALKVLRVRGGESATGIDGKGNQLTGKLELESLAKGRQVWLVGNNWTQVVPSPTRLILEMAVLKGQAMEWIIEKAVELGASEVQPVLMDFCVVQMDKKGPEAFRERWQKIADQSLKQCERAFGCKIHTPIRLEDLIKSHPNTPQNHRIWLFERSASVNPSSDLASQPNHLRLLVGPEGGFSSKEQSWLIQDGVQPTSLGSAIFRAETAALFGLSILSAQTQKIILVQHQRFFEGES